MIETKEMTATRIIEDVREDMRNEYCRYGDASKQDDECDCGHFDDCPLNRL